MNKIFKVIYSKSRHCYVVVSELAKSHCKSTTGTQRTRGTVLSATVLAALTAFSLTSIPMPVGATLANSTAGRDNTSHNVAGSDIASWVVAGTGNDAEGQYSSILGGTQNVAAGSTSTIAGGIHNWAAVQDELYGDLENRVAEDFIGGGEHNVTYGYATTALGGNGSVVRGYESTGVAGGSTGQSARYALSAGYQSVVTDSGVKKTKVIDDKYGSFHTEYSDISTALGYQATADESGTIAVGHDKGDVSGWLVTAQKDAEGHDDYTKEPTLTEQYYDSSYYNRIVKMADGRDAHDAVNLGQLTAVDYAKANADATNIGANYKVFKTDEKDNVVYDVMTGLPTLIDATDEQKKANGSAWGKALGTGKVAEGNDQLVTGDAVYQYIDTVIPTEKSIADKANVNAGNIGINLKGEDGNPASQEAQIENRNAWGQAIGTGEVADAAADDAATNGSQQLVTGGTVYNALQQQRTDLQNDLKYNAGWGIEIGDVTTKNDDDTETITKNVVSLNRNLGTNYGNPWKGEGKVTFEAGGENSLILGGAASILFHNEADDVKAGAYGKDSVLVGGFNNLIKANDDDIYKIQTGEDSVIVGGDTNTVTGQKSVIVGGYQNKATGDHSMINGGASNEATGVESSVFGGQSNKSAGFYASVLGGDHNEADGSWASAIGGTTNTASGTYATTLGGERNFANGKQSVTIGGVDNLTLEEDSTVIGGGANIADGYASFVGGGGYNHAMGRTSTALGGKGSSVNGTLSTGIAGGSTGAKAMASLSAGYQSVVTDTGVEWRTLTEDEMNTYNQKLLSGETNPSWPGFSGILDYGNGDGPVHLLDRISTALGYQATADAPGVIAFGHDKGDVASVAKKWKQKATVEYIKTGDNDYDVDLKYYDANHNEISAEEYYKLANPDGTWNDYTQNPVEEKTTYTSAYYNRLVKAADGIEDHDAVVMEQLKNASDVGSNIKVYKTDENGNVQFDKDNNPIEDISDTAKTKREAAQKASEDAWAAAIGTGKIADPTQSDTNDPTTNGSQQLVTGGEVYNALHGGLDDVILGHDGKDGQPGKDGSIGLVGPKGQDGKDGKTTTIIKTESGAAGVDGIDGKDGITRIIYGDKDNPGDKHTVATLDDGMKYVGDAGDAANVALNHQLKLSGTTFGEDKVHKSYDEKDWTSDNIAVVSDKVDRDGNAVMNLKLSKDLKGLNSSTYTSTETTGEGDQKQTTDYTTTVDSKGVTIQSKITKDGKTETVNGPSMTIDGIDGGGKQITNVGDGIKKNADGSYTISDTDKKNAANIGDVQTIVDKATKDLTDGTNGLNQKANVDASNIGSNIKVYKPGEGNESVLDEEATKQARTDNANAWGRALGTGNIEENNSQLVTGGTIFKETRVSAKDSQGKDKVYRFISASNSAAGNLESLDTQVGHNADAIAENKTGITNNANAINEIKNNIGSLTDNAVQYDDSGKKQITLKGEGGTTIKNVKDGAVAKGSTDAVNGGQLFDEQKARQEADDAINQKIGSLDKDGSYIHKDSSISDNLSHLDDQVGKNTKAIDDLQKSSSDMSGKLDSKADTDLGNLSDEGKQVIKDTMKDDMDKKANVDASNIDASKWAEKLGTGNVAEGDKNLVNGDTVHNAIREAEGRNPVQSDGQTITIGRKDTASKIDVSGIDKNGNTTGRVITGIVSDANDPTSAANVGYVNEVTAANTQRIYRDMNNAYSRLDTNINKAAAGSNALAALHPLEFDPADKASFAVGYGHYHNANAAAIGAFYRPNANTMVNMGVSFGNGDPGFNAGVSFKLGQGSAYNGVSKAEMAQTIQNQAAQISALEQANQKIEKENEEMKAQIQQILDRLNG